MRRLVITVAGLCFLAVFAVGGWWLMQDSVSCMKTDDINYLCDFSRSYNETIRFTTAPGKNTCGQDDGDLIEQGWERCRPIDVSIKCENQERSGIMTIRAGIPLSFQEMDVEVVSRLSGQVEQNLTIRNLTTVGTNDRRIVAASTDENISTLTLRTGRFDPEGWYRITLNSGNPGLDPFLGEQLECTVEE